MVEAPAEQVGRLGGVVFRHRLQEYYHGVNLRG
jgi:hypothetical protein